MYPVGFEDSAQPGNGYQFHCPVVDRDARFLVCAFMRRKHMRGESFEAHDCKCAMVGNKCPAVHMLKLEWTSGDRRFFDKEPTMHRLPKDILERIEKVRLLPSQAAGLSLTVEQRERLFDGNLAVVSAASSSAAEPSATPTKRTRKAKAAAATDLTSGLGEMDTDMASLVNQAMENTPT